MLDRNDPAEFAADSAWMYVQLLRGGGEGGGGGGGGGGGSSFAASRAIQSEVAPGPEEEDVGEKSENES